MKIQDKPIFYPNGFTLSRDAFIRDPHSNLGPYFRRDDVVFSHSFIKHVSKN